jgi:hypothetical protein
MKIKRTKTGTKTSDSKHEIVKTEQNGNAGDDPAQNSNSKKQINVVGVPASSPTSSVNKRGNNSHRKDKVNWGKKVRLLFPKFIFPNSQAKEKVTVKEKSENLPLLQHEASCNCGSDKVGVSCSSSNCTKIRESNNVSRVSNAQVQNSSIDKQTTGTSATTGTPGSPKVSPRTEII